MKVRLDRWTLVSFVTGFLAVEFAGWRGLVCLVVGVGAARL